MAWIAEMRDELKRESILMTTERYTPTQRRWREIIDIVCENICPEWQTLALGLGMSRPEVKRLQKEYTNDKDKCWHVLMEWKTRSHPLRMVHDLVYALNQCNHGRVADIVVLATSNPEDINQLLAPYLQRESRMREAFYTVSDNVHREWRRLAKKLGLTPTNIGDIEKSDHGRTREKCLKALYKWRLMVPLKEYKLATLIQALNAAGLTKVAAKLQPYASMSDVPSHGRRHRKGELIIHVDIDKIEHQPHGRESHLFITTMILKEYALNKLFIRFEDSLELQDKDNVHELVIYFQQMFGATIKRVSRRTRSFLIKCHSPDQLAEISDRTRDGEISEKMTQFLVTEDLLRELELEELKLKAEVSDNVLMTDRSEGSETYRSQIRYSAMM